MLKPTVSELIPETEVNLFTVRSSRRAKASKLHQYGLITLLVGLKPICFGNLVTSTLSSASVGSILQKLIACLSAHSTGKTRTGKPQGKQTGVPLTCNQWNAAHTFVILTREPWVTQLFQQLLKQFLTSRRSNGKSQSLTLMCVRLASDKA
jgi:hypothetical protein